MKIYYIIPFLLLGACTVNLGNNKPYLTDEQAVDFVSFSDETDSQPQKDESLQPTESVLNPIPENDGLVGDSEQNAEPVVAADVAPVAQPVVVEPVVVADVVPVAQPVVVEPVVQPVPPVNQYTPPYLPTTYYTAPVGENYVAETEYVTLQYMPQQPTYTVNQPAYIQQPAVRYVQCLPGDATCIQGYENLGYHQVRYQPQFAGYNEITSVSDYPVGVWRNNNNIPRW